MACAEVPFIKVDPESIAFEAARLYVLHGSWPTPRHLHLYLADKYRYPIEHAEHDVLMALNAREVYGLPTIVGRRLGEVVGDWRAPLDDDDNGFRIAMAEEWVPTAVAILRRSVA
jgi:hypothetical protein